MTKSKKVNGVSNGTYEWHKCTSYGPVHFEGESVGSGGVLTTDLRHCTREEELEYERRVTRKLCGEKEAKEGYEEYETETPAYIECKSEKNTGETVGKDKIQNIEVKFLGCAAFGQVPCSNGPYEEGEINTNLLEGELGYINKKENKVGVRLTPVAKHGQFASFECSRIETVVGQGNSKEGAYYEPEKDGGNDGIISPITPVNKMTGEFTQVFKLNPETYENIPNKFEGKPISLLEDFFYRALEPLWSTDWSRAGEEITNVNHSEPGEIKT